MHHIDEKEEKQAKRFFHHEKLDAYRVGRQAQRFVADRRAKLRGLPGGAGPQLERAIVGAQTNLCGKRATNTGRARHHHRNGEAESYRG